MRSGWWLALCALAALAAASSARADVPAGYVQTTLVSQGLARPVALAYAPDGRLFIGEQYTGAIKIFKNGAVLSTPFATLPTVFDNAFETGLIGLAIDPAFATNGFVYVMATVSSSEQIVYRYTAQGDLGTDRTTLIPGLPSMGVNHNGGGIGFGPDGLLYVSVGDNGGAPNDAQSLSSRRGKLMRFNKDGTDAAAVNPFGDEVFCYGLRNTFRFCFQPGTGAIYSSENGTAADEINVLEAGINYGWPVVEGIRQDARFRDPILAFSPTIAPTGITFYGGADMPALQGSLLFCDYNNRRLRRVVLGGAGGPALSDFATSLPGQPIEVLEAPDGSLTISTLTGNIVRIEAAAPGNQAPFASFTATPATGAAPLTVTFDATASSDPDGTIAGYAWSFDDGGTATGAQVAHDFIGARRYDVRLTVTDDDGATATTLVHVVATTGGTFPVGAHIEEPPDGSVQTAATVRFRGHGHDDGLVVEHRWEFPDGAAPVVIANPGTDQNTEVDHSFASDGPVSVTLTVTDDQGNRASDTVSLTIAAGRRGGGGGGGCSAGGASGAAAAWIAAVAAACYFFRFQSSRRRPSWVSGGFFSGARPAPGDGRPSR